jgi:hypothetical protein
LPFERAVFFVVGRSERVVGEKEGRDSVFSIVDLRTFLRVAEKGGTSVVSGECSSESEELSCSDLED